MDNAQRIHDGDQFDRATLVLFMRDKLSWRTASEIRSWTGLTASRVRQLCQIYPTLLVSSQEGYKLTANASHIEIIRSVQDLLSRSEKITARASALAGML